MATFQLSADKRADKKVHHLRKEGLIPATVYGKNFPALSLQIKLDDFKAVYTQAGQTGLVELHVGPDKIPALIHQYDRHPIGNQFRNVEFYKVLLNEKVTANIPLHVVGEAPAIKLGGYLLQSIDELELEGFPQDLISEVQVDISHLENVGDTILVKDLSIPSNLTLISDPEALVVKIQPLQEETPETEETAEQTMPEVIGEKKDDEEQPA